MSQGEGEAFVQELLDFCTVPSTAMPLRRAMSWFGMSVPPFVALTPYAEAYALQAAAFRPEPSMD